MATVGPVVDQLPTAPNRGMSSAQYPIIADAWAAKIGPWTTQVNEVTTWMGQVVDFTYTARDAAAASAQAASNSAIQAGLKVTAAAEQVALANTAKNASAVSALEAKSYAQAAQAGTVPTPLPNTYFNADTNGVAGWRTLVIPPVQTPGDVLVTARNPGSTFLPADRTIYSQAAYPLLFAQVGAVTDADRATLVTIAGGSLSNVGLATAHNGTGTIVVSNIGSNVISRSTDYGMTWANVTLPANDIYLKAVDYGLGMFIAFGSAPGNQTGTRYYTSPDGLTWTARTLPYSSIWQGCAFCKGYFMVYGGFTVILTSPDGLTWTQGSAAMNSYSPCFRLKTEEGVILSGANGGGSGVYFFSPDGINYYQYNAVSSINAILKIGGKYFTFLGGGAWTVYAANSPAGPWALHSTVSGPYNNSGDYGYPVLGLTNEDCAIFLAQVNGYGVATYDSGTTWVQIKIAISPTGPGISLPNKFYIPLGASGHMEWPLRSYDKNTQFITPKAVTQLLPLKTYVKALAA